MMISPTNAPSVVFARPRVAPLAVSSWSVTIAGNNAMCLNHGDTTGTTESKRLGPGHFMGVLT